MSPPTGETSKKAGKARKMNKKDLNKFEKILEEEKNRLISALGLLEKTVIGRSLREAIADLAASNYNPEEGSDNSEREKVLQYATSEGRLLYEIEDAIRKIGAGEYGICEECEEIIDNVRLEALPHARLCLKCQEKADRQRA
ncbi:MAG: TraR/DksA family transcriptional regulator [Candidatus Eisenbacteria bacterium]|uniref:TraR/DksA family transcriptional regulator n=1 Tax=Eiseniibacteriota bacterium TaxID=2212470 RepID=A0A948W8P8_UNCEI|nr:TraR/DksA family transcriptional regulator [Candidatus Eisenbacteria bacterium]MBU2692906.1 TraR/DksA family transcriptional regulator [Candidatus Eisenbacteria bacterium]